MSEPIRMENDSRNEPAAPRGAARFPPPIIIFPLARPGRADRCATSTKLIAPGYLRRTGSGVRDQRDHIADIQLCGERGHHGALPRTLLEIPELAHEIARAAPGNAGNVVFPVQIRTVAARAAGGLAAAIPGELAAFGNAPNRHEGNKAGV